MQTQQGQHLAELTRYYAGFRASFLRWATKKFQRPQDLCLANYRRALLTWYEATIRPEDPFLGEADDFVKALTGYYFNPSPIQQSLAGNAMPFGDDLRLATQERPLHYIPLPIHLNGAQQQMLAGFQQMTGRCQELLLMHYYHRLDHGRMAQVLEIPGGVADLEDELHKCRLLAHESWQMMGIVDAAHSPSPADDDLIEAYYTRQLETTERWAVEARFPNDPIFRKAAELREDWLRVLTVAGRQDLMQLLQREEAQLLLAARPTDPASRQRTGLVDGQPAPAATRENPDVPLSRRRRLGSDLQVPGIGTILAALLLCAFFYLAYTTFRPAAVAAAPAATFEPFPNIFDRLEPRNEDERDLQRILFDYDREDYATAYDELLPVADAYPAAPLYLGVSALALDQPDRALDWFDRVEPTDYYHPFAEWYEALAYIDLRRTAAARATLLDILTVPNHPYRERAELLLAEID